MTVGGGGPNGARREASGRCAGAPRIAGFVPACAGMARSGSEIGR